MIRSLAVFLNDYPVGRLERSVEGTELRFREEYWGDPDHPILGQTFEDRPGRNYREKSGGVPRFFAHVLPEGVLADLLRNRYGLDSDDDFGLLKVVGEDLPGAVIVRDDDEEHALIPGTAFESSAPPTVQDEDGFRFSLAGVQLKLSVAQEDERLTVSIDGTKIAKFPAPAFAGLILQR